MPDHLHVLVVAGAAPKSLSQMVRDVKVFSSRAARTSLWQRGFYEHIVRSDEILETIAFYIVGNPVRAGLAEHPEDWPWTIRDW
jgi:REP element-mobilizing transposase RayT